MNGLSEWIVLKCLLEMQKKKEKAWSGWDGFKELLDENGWELVTHYSFLAFFYNKQSIH